MCLDGHVPSQPWRRAYPPARRAGVPNQSPFEAVVTRVAFKTAQHKTFCRTQNKRSLVIPPVQNIFALLWL